MWNFPLFVNVRIIIHFGFYQKEKYFSFFLFSLESSFLFNKKRKENVLRVYRQTLNLFNQTYLTTNPCSLFLFFSFVNNNFYQALSNLQATTNWLLKTGCCVCVVDIGQLHLKAVFYPAITRKIKRVLLASIFGSSIKSSDEN